MALSNFNHPFEFLKTFLECSFSILKNNHKKMLFRFIIIWINSKSRSKLLQCDVEMYRIFANSHLYSASATWALNFDLIYKNSPNILSWMNRLVCNLSFYFGSKSEENKIEMPVLNLRSSLLCLRLQDAKSVYALIVNRKSVLLLTFLATK